MSEYLFLIPLSIAMGVVGLATFLWTLKDKQYDDLDGASYRILDEDDFPLSSHNCETATKLEVEKPIPSK